MKPLVNIIHGNQASRLPLLMKELEEQGVDNYRIWEGLHDTRSVVSSINLSHRQIVQWAKDEGLEKVIIFEDDIKFFGNGAFDYYVVNEPEDYDLYLGAIYVGEILEGVTKDFCGFHIYTVHNRFYDKYLSTPINQHIDRAMKNLGKFVVCEPFVAEQFDGVSANTGKNEQYRNLLNGRNLFNSK